MEILLNLFDFVMHIDQHLNQFANDYGLWLYAILFLIIFVETGVVVMPFLPGDSLLFAAGMVAALPDNDLNVWIIMGLLIIAAILGDTLNYSIGRSIGYKAVQIKIFGKQFVLPEHLDKTHEFYEKYGAKTIVIARFVPIVRTLAPFVAGIGKMSYKTFLTYNVVGGIIWIVSLTLAGYFLGSVQWVQENFSKVVLAIIVISLFPLFYEVFKDKFTKKEA
ncbi:DedA family protein [Faecalibacter bovis]|uniref:DedA family protein n=1 Tax=Faecalibacter bovis TaxID=2898187 RepID=A0ABX7XGE3_9FLAO|nr:DedA family protein [Faecalibacter bovis]MBS7332007.1 DedA family protein [Weeksellaceae bacterium]QTV06915.1 DedA family protein [Faecalibacter bovis]